MKGIIAGEAANVWDERSGSFWPVAGLDLLVSAGFPGIAPRFDAKNNDFPRNFYGDTV